MYLKSEEMSVECQGHAHQPTGYLRGGGGHMIIDER